MSRYIDANALKNKITELDGGCAVDGTGFDIYTCEVFELIDEVPTADVVGRNECSKCVLHPFKQLREQLETNMVEVVRCEDCRYWENRFDVMVCNLTDGMKGASDYCSYGERRGE